jgi:hypothetical protein
MTPCPDCAAAATQLWAVYRSDCHGCLARILARGIACWRAEKAVKGSATYTEHRQAYRDALQKSGITHEQVLEARRVDFQSQPSGTEA